MHGSKVAALLTEVLLEGTRPSVAGGMIRQLPRWRVVGVGCHRSEDRHDHIHLVLAPLGSRAPRALFASIHWLPDLAADEVEDWVEMVLHEVLENLVSQRGPVDLLRVYLDES